MNQSHPTGERIPIDGVTILDVRVGRIQAVRTHYDTTACLQFLPAVLDAAIMTVGVPARGALG